MSEKRWTGRATQKAASNATARMRGAVSQGAARAAARAKGISEDIAGAATTIPDLIAGIEGPTVPLHNAWSIGLGQVLSGHPQLPDKLRGVARNLDRLGHLQISAETISFDGQAVPWKDIHEITFGPVNDIVTPDTIQTEIGRLTARLPHLPGRDWLVRQAVEVLVALCLAAAGTTPENDLDTPTVGTADNAANGIPVTITYGGRLRRKELTPGVFVALIAASTPTVAAAIVSIAQQHGIKVVVAPPSRSRKQAIAMRKIAGSLSSRSGRGGEPSAIERGDTPEPAIVDPSDGE